MFHSHRAQCKRPRKSFQCKATTILFESLIVIHQYYGFLVQQNESVAPKLSSFELNGVLRFDCRKMFDLKMILFEREHFTFPSNLEILKFSNITTNKFNDKMIKFRVPFAIHNIDSHFNSLVCSLRVNFDVSRAI